MYCPPQRMEPQVFNYHDPVEFLNASLKATQLRNPSFSLRSWSKQLGMNHVAMLSMVLNRKRKLLPSLSSKISNQYLATGKFKDVEARYFDMLVLFNNSQTLEEKSFYEGILSSLKPDHSFSTLALDQLKIISDWYHAAILEMTALKNFNSDPQWISLKLGESVTLDQVKTAIERLLRLGLLERSNEGKLIRTKVLLATPTDVPNKSLRQFHTQWMNKAIHALETQSVETRDITSYTMTVDSKKLPEAKKMIRDFRRKLARFLETEGGDTVYQLNVQLFDLLDADFEKNRG